MKAKETKLLKDRYLQLYEMMKRDNIEIKEYVVSYSKNDQIKMYPETFRGYVFKDGIKLGVISNNNRGITNCSFLGIGQKQFYQWIQKATSKIYGKNHHDLEPKYMLLQFTKIIHDLHLVQTKDELILRCLPRGRKKETFKKTEGLLYSLKGFTVEELRDNKNRILETLYDNCNIDSFQIVNILFDNDYFKNKQ